MSRESSAQPVLSCRDFESRSANLGVIAKRLSAHSRRGAIDPELCACWSSVNLYCRKTFISDTARRTLASSEAELESLWLAEAELDLLFPRHKTWRRELNPMTTWREREELPSPSSATPSLRERDAINFQRGALWSIFKIKKPSITLTHRAISPERFEERPPLFTERSSE